MAGCGSVQLGRAVTRHTPPRLRERRRRSRDLDRRLSPRLRERRRLSLSRLRERRRRSLLRERDLQTVGDEAERVGRRCLRRRRRLGAVLRRIPACPMTWIGHPDIPQRAAQANGACFVQIAAISPSAALASRAAAPPVLAVPAA